ncbi:MAG TPA: RIP metalloprotease RseP [Cryomorphaceae bacterium]|nr:RIP metalloprotease RseP [Owenweeksia sp.]MBF97621.1 RIP metalloprotease RseP [Owenweeksia sp.]HAD95934.1 RIP metalloprotease RseP [Cryomorphaceae bacterium]HBF20530.1 RIP metalloprotease RseP [Cryomorphaceae bacterium]|tara:strand:- start:2734 stop:4065 length:1332 start_codon:yes stop_codon:yes gene_type:complete
MDILIQASQFILSLSLLIILHELGHFIPAKLFKTRVEKFYLFFDPWFSIFKKKIGETEYGIGWLPLGGYVKIAGMIDESMDKEQMKQPPQPWEFRSKPAWQRLIIMIGGVTVNVILAMVIYAGMLMHYGEEYLPNENVIYGITADSTAQSLGFRDGDKIVSVGGKKIERFSDISLEVLLGDNGNIVVERNGRMEEFTISADKKSQIIDSQKSLVGVRIPFVVAEVADSSAAKAAGLMVGDSLTGINGESLAYFNDYPQYLKGREGQEITLNFVRNGESKEAQLQIPAEGKYKGSMGVMAYPVDRYLDFSYRKYGFFEAIPAGIQKSGKVLTDYVRQFKLIANPETGAYKHVGGFLMIANQYSTSWDWQRFWAFTAFLSIMLAFLNILPIPALDGGHVVFVLWEMITGRKPAEKVLEYAQVAGFIILLALIVLANGNDILKLFN